MVILSYRVLSYQFVYPILNSPPGFRCEMESDVYFICQLQPLRYQDTSIQIAYCVIMYPFVCMLVVMPVLYPFYSGQIFSILLSWSYECCPLFSDNQQIYYLSRYVLLLQSFTARVPRSSHLIIDLHKPGYHIVFYAIIYIKTLNYIQDDNTMQLDVFINVKLLFAFKLSEKDIVK